VSGGIPDPNVVHPLPTTDRVVFLKPVLSSDKIEVGDYTYYDDADDPTAFEQNNVRLLRAAWWDWPVELVTKHACTIMSGTPADVERIARENGLAATAS
jgi:virginiamycin A acetyltransferase